MVVDDQLDVAESTARLLRLAGHDVLAFTSADAVLDALPEFVPDLILADISMPGMDGCQLATEIKQRPGCEKIIVAALTGRGEEADRQAAVAAGFDYRFVKPMLPDELSHFVTEIAVKR